MRTFGKALLNHWGWLVYGLLSATVVFLLTRGGVNLSPDSINYLSIAQILKTSQWIKSFVATNPPFFPLSIALINSLGFEAEVSTRIISVISYSVLVIIIFLLAKATSGALVAHLSSISMLFFAPLLFVYSYCWSETAYIALSAISLLTLDRFYRSTGVKSKRYLMWCAVFVGLALLARYIGVALFLTGFLLVLFKKETQMPIEKIKSLILFSIIACTPLTVYLMGCLHYQGRLPGYGGHGMASLGENVISFFGTIYHDFLTFDLRFSNPSLFPYVVSWRPNAPLHILGKIAGAIFLSLLLVYFVRKLFKETIRSQIVPIAYMARYSLFFVLITTIWVPLSTSTRFCSPIYPFVLILIFSVIVVCCKSAIRRKTKLLFCGGSIFVVLIFWFIQLGSSVNVYMRMEVSEVAVVKQPDITGDGIFGVSDVIYLTNYLYRDGPRPRPLQNANVNCDETINISDLVYLINYMYRDGPPPCNLEDR